ncbi:YraN family protein [Streptomyces sp. NPDC007063]|uniref:YraN family protein n=1 Tax=Streptomyces sp. NPDC007063 TaxID=3364772 RepID=UPI0036BF8549
MNTGETHNGADTARPRTPQAAGERPGGRSPRGGPDPGRREDRRRPACARGALGRYGEDLAARRLREAGMAVLERNWRCAEGEIDIVARDADAIVICEVKTRRAVPFQTPMGSLPPARTARLRRLAGRWLSERWIARHGRPPTGGVRIDLVGIVLPGRGAPVVEHVRGIG